MASKPPGGWGLTPIEIAIDLELPQLFDSSTFGVCGPAEPRVSVVVGFALTQQLKRIVAAVDRAVPVRLPSRLRIASSKARLANGSCALSIAPMPPLLRLQSKLIRAIEPGLTPRLAQISPGKPRGMEPHTVHFIRDFISTKAPPMLEPPCLTSDFVPTSLMTAGITLYRLDRQGKPQSVLGHWSYPQRSPASLPLRSTP